MDDALNTAGAVELTDTVIPAASDPSVQPPAGTTPAGTIPAQTMPASGPGESAPAQTPETSGPGESAPAQTQGTEAAGTGDGKTGEESGEKTGTLIETIEDFATGHIAAFGGICAGAGVTVALIVALIAALIRRGARKKRNKAKAPEMKVRVDKLHEQGARKDQQDCFAVSPAEFADRQGVLAIVADGMGGLEHGEQVSQAAVSAALNGFFTATGSHEQVLLELLRKAVEAVDRLLGPEGLKKSGSTMVMGLLRDGRFGFISVGDSRICLYRNGQLYKLNREHTYKSELAARAVSGEIKLSEVYEHPKSGGLTSYLGMGNIKYVDMPVCPMEVLPGDIFALMSDGVYNAVTDAELMGALAGSAPADSLRALVSSKGYINQDNYTAVILSVEEGVSKSERRK